MSEKNERRYRFEVALETVFDVHGMGMLAPLDREPPERWDIAGFRAQLDASGLEGELRVRASVGYATSTTFGERAVSNALQDALHAGGLERCDCEEERAAWSFGFQLGRREVGMLWFWRDTLIGMLLRRAAELSREGFEEDDSRRRPEEDSGL